MNPKLIFLILLGILGIWLVMWDLVDFLTQGLNQGIWEWSIIQAGFPSIFVGFIIIMIVSVLGIRVIK